MRAVLTGGPCVGKSTLIRMLSELGFPVISEMATEVINDGGPYPWDDHEAFQYEVLSRQLDEEARCGFASLLFLDRGAFDGVPYREIYGRTVPDFFAALASVRYDVCFLLDPLPWEDDGLRYEDETFTSEIQPYFARVYRNADIPVVRVPVASPEERLRFILDVVGKEMRRDLTAKLRLSLSASSQSHRKERRWISTSSPAARSHSVPRAALVSVTAN